MHCWQVGPIIASYLFYSMDLTIIIVTGHLDFEAVVDRYFHFALWGNVLEVLVT